MIIYFSPHFKVHLKERKYKKLKGKWGEVGCISMHHYRERV